MNDAPLFAAFILAISLVSTPARAYDDDAPSACFVERWSEMMPPSQWVGPNEPKRVRTITIPTVADADLTETPDVTGTTGELRSHPNGYFVQVAVQRTAAEALAWYRGLQVKHSVMLGGREPDIRRVEAQDTRAYFRVAIGPFESAGQADAFCARLRADGGKCDAAVWSAPARRIIP